MRNLRRHPERGMSISMAILALTMISFIMLYVGTQTLNSMYVARKKSDNSVGMAAGDSAIEKVRAALQAGLASEDNDFRLDQAALKLLVSQQPGAEVISNTAAPGYAQMVPVRVDPALRYTVREPGTDTIGYWQVFDVITPRYHKDQPNDVVYYIRAWATAKGSDTITTKPRVFRVEFRPSWFTDYQSVTNAPFFVKDNANVTVSGPIHSNGYTVLDWLALDDSQTTRRGIYFKDAPTCNARAKFSTSQGQGIVVPGASCAQARNAGKTNARQLSLLGVQETFRQLDARCPSGNGLVHCRNGAGSYNVQLGSQSVRVNGEVIQLRPRADSASAVIVLDGDVVIRGALTMPPQLAGRVTIATRRRTATDRQPQVHLRGDLGPVVGVLDPTKDTVGIITQGDVILDTRNYGPCMSRINLAAISQAGSVTVPPEFVTLTAPAYDLSTLDCNGATSFFGSFSAHGQFLPSIKWPDVRNPGQWTGTVGYSRPNFAYNPNLYTNPAPFFPIAIPWAVSKAKDANDRCLVPPHAGDPRCE